MNINRRLLAGSIAVASAALCLGISSNAVAAEKFPERPIMFIVPFPPGGPTDAMARILATELTRELGQSVIVENKAGAGGMSVRTSWLAPSRTVTR